jgi:PKD repeat protein
MRGSSWALVATVVLLTSAFFAPYAGATASSAPGASPLQVGPASGTTSEARTSAQGAALSALIGSHDLGTVAATKLLYPNLHTSGSARSTPTTSSTGGTGAWVDVTGLSPLYPGDSVVRGVIAAYPPAGESILFGGVTAASYLQGETWTFTNGTWANITATAGGPGPLLNPDMAYDPALQAVVLFSGCNDLGYGSQITWTFAHGVWTNITADPINAGSPPETCENEGMSTDWADNTVVVSGRFGSYGYEAGTWTFGASGWTNLTTTLGVDQPEVAPFGGSVADPGTGGGLLSGGIDVPHEFPDAWLFIHGHWYNQTSLGALPSLTFFSDLGPVPSAGAVLIPSYYNPITGYTTSATWGWTNSSGWQNWTSRVGDLGFLLAPSVGPLPGSEGTLVMGGTICQDSACSPSVISDQAYVFAPTLSLSGTASASAVQLGTPIWFNGTFSGGLFPKAWGWTFGDGSTSSQASAERNYAAPGTYFATFWVTDAAGNTNSTSIKVQVVAVLTATATASVTGSDAGQAIDFTGTAVGGDAPLTYAWAFGDGSKSSNPSGWHTYAKAGGYTATFWANDSLGHSAHATLAIAVAADPTVTITASPTSAAAGTAIAFSATPTGGTTPYAAYSWSFGDGSWGTAATPTHTYGKTGTFTVNLTLTDSAGRWANASTTVTISAVLAPLTVSAVANVGGGTVGTAFTFTATAAGGAGGYTYAWSENPASGLGCAASTSTTLSCTSTATGQYTVTVTATDSASHTATASVVVNVLTSSSSSSSSSVGGFSTTALAIMGVLAVLVLLFAVLWARKGKGPKPAAAAPAAEAPAPTPMAPAEPPAAPPPPAPAPPPQTWSPGPPPLPPAPPPQ